MKQIAIILILSVLGTLAAHGQNYFGLLNEGRHLISTGINASPHLNANADYLFGSDNQNSFIERYGIIAQANFPLFSQKGFDFDLRLGTGALLNFVGNLKAISGLSWNISRTSDINGRYLHSGFKLEILPGYYGKKWAFAPHLSINYQPWINIKHSEYAINAFHDLYPNTHGQYKAPKDGWLYQNNITLQTGVGIAYFQPQWYLNFTAGFQYQPNRLGVIALPDIGIMPFYGGINFGYSLSSMEL